MKLNDLIISPLSLGAKYWLVDVAPIHEYKDGVKTQTIIGYRYFVALPEKGLEKIGVRIDGQKLMDTPENYIEVRFDELKVSIGWSRGDYIVMATASGIHQLTPNNK